MRQPLSTSTADGPNSSTSVASMSFSNTRKKTGCLGSGKNPQKPIHWTDNNNTDNACLVRNGCKKSVDLSYVENFGLAICLHCAERQRGMR